MAPIGISEFTYGYAFLFEQTTRNWGSLRAAPILPSLQQEATDGWDVKLPIYGVDYYYQFKISDYLSRRNAKYIRDGTYPGPYFQFLLYKKNYNSQHQNLRRLSKTHENVYYVAPEFKDTDEFNNAFLSKTISAGSRLIRVAECTDHCDTKQHDITFEKGSPNWKEHSEKKDHDDSIRGSEIVKFYHDNNQKGRRIDRKFIDDIFIKTRDAVRDMTEIMKPRTMKETAFADKISKIMDSQPQSLEQSELLSNTSQLLSAIYGVVLVIVGEYLD